MNKQEREAFVRNLCDSVRDHVLSKLDAVPDDWNGHELRNVIAAEFDAERSVQARGNTRRAREFRIAASRAGLRF